MEQPRDVQEYVDMLRRHKLMFAAVVLVVFAAALIYTLTVPKSYEARALILVADHTSGIISSQPKPDIETQKELLLSGSVMDKVYSAHPGKEFDIRAEALKDTTILEVSVRAGEPELAMSVANSAAKSYLDYALESRLEDEVSVNSFLTEQIDAYRTELDMLNARLMQYNQSAGLSLADKLEQQNLQREVTAKNKLYDYLLSKKEESGLAVKEQSGSAKIIEYASLPMRPRSPNLWLYLMSGLVLAVAVASAVVVNLGSREISDVDI